MGCTSSKAAGAVRAPTKHGHHKKHKLESHVLSERYANAHHICDFLAPSELSRNPYRRLEAKPVFVVKSRREEITEEGITARKVFVNLFRTKEITTTVVEILKYVVKKNEDECDVYNVVIPNDSKYFKDEAARDAMIREVLTGINVKYEQQISMEFVLPRIAKGFIGDKAPTYFIVPCACATEISTLFHENDDSALYKPFNLLTEAEAAEAAADSTSEVKAAGTNVQPEEQVVSPTVVSTPGSPARNREYTLVDDGPNSDDDEDYDQKVNEKKSDEDDGDDDEKTPEIDHHRISIDLTPDQAREFRIK
jgi:hypothetical protein